jgi:hypothetical protein
MNPYRSDKNQLLETLKKWDALLSGRRIHLIACGGTALTLLGYKESTKDVDFMVPEENEYERLVKFLASAGYQQDSGSFGWRYPGENIIYDLYKGKRVFTTELLESPLREGGHKKIIELKKIYVGVLNSIDWTITKMFRGTLVDREDCLALAKHESIDLQELEIRFKETAKYDINESRMLGHLEVILDDLKKLKEKI